VLGQVQPEDVCRAVRQQGGIVAGFSWRVDGDGDAFGAGGEVSLDLVQPSRQAGMVPTLVPELALERAARDEEQVSGQPDLHTRHHTPGWASSARTRRNAATSSDIEGRAAAGEVSARSSARHNPAGTTGASRLRGSGCTGSGCRPAMEW